MKFLKNIALTAAILLNICILQTAAFADSLEVTARDSYVDGNGLGHLRFITKVNFDDEEKTVEKLGTWIVPKTIFAGWDSDNVVTLEKSDATDMKNGDEFKADIRNIPTNLLNLEFYAKSYIVYRDNENKQKWVQAPLASENVDNSENTKVNTTLTEDEQHKPTYYHSTDDTHTNTPDEVAADVDKSLVTFEKKFKNTDKYLYRVGNAANSTVKLSSLFEVTSDAQPAAVEVKVINKAGNAGGNYTSNSTWGNGTIQFSGTGVVEVAIKDSDDTQYCTLLLEVVEATNATSAMSATNKNVVLLNDVRGSLSVSSGHTLYGNGFAVRDTRTGESTKGTAGYVTISSGVVDNVQFIGYEPTASVAYGTSNQGYAPSVRIEPNSSNSKVEIYNSYISGGRYACITQSGEIYFNNVLIDGGAVGNMSVSGGADVTLENCKTTNSTRGLKGIGIHVEDLSAKINIKGTFEQHNWVKQSDVPSDYRNFLNSVYNNAEYYYTSNGNKYVNMGILFANSSLTFTEQDVNNIINDETGNAYGIIKNSPGMCYTAKSSMANDEVLGDLTFSPSQYSTIPVAEFDYTTKNYRAKTDGDNNYCYYDSTAKTVNISFDKATPNRVFEWDSMILSVNKNGKPLSYTVSMNGIDYTDKKISFADSGNYAVTYTYTDQYNYDKDGETYPRTYTKTVNIHVNAVEPEDVTYYAEFTYNIGGESVNAKKTIVGNSTYVMPDVSATDSNIGSTTVSGKTIYYPIVTLDGRSSTNKTYSSGKIYYFAPAFKVINITDYNQDTGVAQYTYNANSQKWPHNINGTTGPGSSTVYGPASTRDPYGASTGATYEKYKFQSGEGLCFTSNEIERTVNANDKLVKFHYTSNDGTTYYYYIKYHYNATTYDAGSCFATGTLINLADGTKKPIEDITYDDDLLVWDFFEGKYTSNKPSMIFFHGNDNWDVINMHFDDGTSLKMIEAHGFFDVAENNFVYINVNNIDEYIGHKFIEYDRGNRNEVTLTGYDVTTEYTGSYSIQTAVQNNFTADDILSLTPVVEPAPEGWFDYFTIGDNMKYDEQLMMLDIAKYGLYSYDDFKDYVTYEQFIAFDGPYLKVLVGKGILKSYDEILNIIAVKLQQ